MNKSKSKRPTEISQQETVLNLSRNLSQIKIPL